VGKSKAEETGFDAMVGREETALVPVDEVHPEERAVRTFSQDMSGMGEEDVFYPRLRLAQGLTPEVSSGDARPGDWLLLGSDPVSEVDFIPLMWGTNRRRTVKDENGDDVVVCRSGDSLTGYGEPGGDCTSCPHAKWQPSPKNAKKNAPPACLLTYSYVGYSVTHDQLASLDLKDTMSQGGAARNINTLLKGKGIGNLAITLIGTPEQGERGRYHKVGVKVNKTVEKDTFELARELIAPS
jgi:hypothetical protein